MISFLSHKPPWASLRRIPTTMHGTRTHYGPRGNELVEHIFTILIEQSMLSGEYSLCTFQLRTHINTMPWILLTKLVYLIHLISKDVVNCHNLRFDIIISTNAPFHRCLGMLCVSGED